MTEAALAVVPQKRAVSISPLRMKLAEYDRQEWVVNAEVGTTIDDVLKFEYWAHIAENMKPYDHIEVRAEDDSWLAYLIVRRVERSAAVVHLLHHYEFDAPARSVGPALVHEVQWKGPQRRFAVVRLSDAALIKDEFATKDEAGRWLREYERTTG